MPVLVSKLNIEHVQKIVDEGKANFVIKPNKTTRINLKYAMHKKGTPILWGDKIQRGEIIINPYAEFGKKDFVLQEGDVIIRGDKRITEIEVAKKKPYKIEIGDLVERHLTNNDLVLFNRQPSLHNGSMVAMKILIKPGKTFKFNLSTTKSFNADLYDYYFLFFIM
jgi:DNA-directed RNA polymerase beta' subunit